MALHAERDSERPDGATRPPGLGEPVEDDLVAAASTMSGPNVGMPIADGPMTGDAPEAALEDAHPGTIPEHATTVDEEEVEEEVMAAPSASAPGVGLPIADGG